MKKKIAVLIAAMLLLSATGCTTKESSPKSLKEYGLNMAGTLDSLAESEDYAKIFTSAAEVTSITEEIGNQDYSTPRVVFKITGLGDAMLKSFGVEEMSLSPELKDIIGKRFSTALSNQINGMNGAAYLAATSFLTYEESFIFKGVDKPTTYLYLYQGKYGVTVSYNPSNDNIVGALASFIINESFPEIQTVDDLTSFLADLGITNVEISLEE